MSIVHSPSAAGAAGTSAETPAGRCRWRRRLAVDDVLLFVDHRSPRWRIWCLTATKVSGAGSALLLPSRQHVREPGGGFAAAQRSCGTDPAAGEHPAAAGPRRCEHCPPDGMAVGAEVGLLRAGRAGRPSATATAGPRPARGQARARPAARQGRGRVLAAAARFVPLLRQPRRRRRGMFSSRRRPMIIFWISAVPSPISSMGASR